MKKKSSKRRRAIKCELVNKSQSNSGYFKYMITIEEKNGEVHKESAYGYDMQDAIKRLVRSENADKIVKVVEKRQSFFILALFACCFALPIAGSLYTKERFFLFLPMIIIVVLFILLAIIDNYQSRGN